LLLLSLIYWSQGRLAIRILSMVCKKSVKQIYFFLWFFLIKVEKINLLIDVSIINWFAIIIIITFRGIENNFVLELGFILLIFLYREIKWIIMVFLLSLIGIKWYLLKLGIPFLFFFTIRGSIPYFIASLCNYFHQFFRKGLSGNINKKIISTFHFLVQGFKNIYVQERYLICLHIVALSIFQRQMIISIPNSMLGWASGFY